MRVANSLLLFLILFLNSCAKKEVTAEVNEIFSTHFYQDLEEHQKSAFLDSLHNNVENSANTKALRAFLFDIATEYFYLNNQSKSIEINRQTLNLASQVKDTLDMARANYFIGDSYEPTKKDSAYHFYLQAEKLYKLGNDPEQVGRMKLNKSALLFFQGNYIESEVELTGALAQLVNSNDFQLLFACYNLMGSNFEKLEDYPNAMKYYLLAEKTLQKMKPTDTVDRHTNYAIASSINIAYIYEKTGKFQESIQVLESINTAGLEKDNPKIYAIYVSNLGYSKMKVGNFKEAEPLLLKSLEITQRLDRPADILPKLNNLGEFYEMIGDTVSSLKYLKQAIALAESTRRGEGYKNTLRLLSLMDPKNDAVYKEKYINYADSLFKRQRQNRNKFARIEYETARVEDQNKLLNTRNLKIISGAMLAIFLLSGLLIIRYLSSQKREKIIKKEQEKADEELALLLKKHQMQVAMTRQQEQTRISRELHDGIMNQIYGVRLHLEMLNNLDDAESKTKRLKFVDVLQNIEKEVRMISHDLQKDSFNDHADYLSFIYDMVSQHNAIAKTRFSFEANLAADWEEVSGLIKVNINRIIQESILNVNKYAQAEHCWITLFKGATEIILTIKDNGHGFAMTKTNVGIGLKNMKSRAQIVNGKISIKSEVGTGTIIELHIPIQPK